MEMMDVVDKDDIVVGRASRKEVYEKRLSHRIVHVMVFDREGRMLLQLRSANVGFRPGFWATSAGGHVSAGETYEEAARRELREEIGITAGLEPFCKETYDDPFYGTRKFLGVFKTIHEGPFSVDPAEVEKVAFFSLEELHALPAGKLHPELLFLLRRHFGFPTL